MMNILLKSRGGSIHRSTQRTWALKCGLLLLGLLLSFSASASGSPDSSSDRACPGSDVRVIAADTRDFRDACHGAQAAIAFFSAYGLQPTEPLVLEITPALPEEAGATAVGCYLEQGKRVFMLPYAEFSRQKRWFNLPISRDIYRALAAHEVAHALPHCNFAVPRPTIQAKEYVAYVAMFATMSPSLRARVLRALPGEGFSSEDKITAIFYMFEPMRFGAESYRHFIKPENGPTFLKSVLAGRALAE